MKNPCIQLLVLALACGEGMSPGELDSVGLSPYPGWPEAVVSRSVPASFRTTITALEVDPRGEVWLLRDAVSGPAQLEGTPVLERYAPTGHLERRIGFPAQARASSFVLHPSGALTVFVLRAEGSQGYRLELLRLSRDGDVLSTVAFEELPGPRENLFYPPAGGVQELPVVPFRLGLTSHVAGVADGEGLYLLAEWTYGFKLYRLDAALQRLWGAQLMPANIGAAFQTYPSLIARGEDGVYVATQLFADDAHIYGEHFGRESLVPIGSYDALVQKFDPGGQFSGVRLFGGPAVDHASAMEVREGVILIGGAARITKSDAPNRTMEWDLALMRGGIDAASPLEYRTLDLSRDDFGWAMARAPDGRVLVGGRSGYVQVDTNSEVENGKGLLLTLGPDLAQQSVLELPTPRDVQVRAMRLRSDGSLVLAGTRDGPLTHTDPSMTNNDGFWAVVRTSGSAF